MTTLFSKSVSKKFFNDICERIDSTCIICGDPAILRREVLDIIEAYLSDSCMPETTVSVEARMIFTLLRPEIDRAVSRSKAARIRALQKKEKVASHILKSEIEAVVKSIQKESVVSQSKNRRERRRELQAVKRAIKLKNKPLQIASHYVITQ